jgi:hypothetical protein
MTSPDKRRPLPALAFLVILTLLAGVVWWRVLHRAKSHPRASSTSSCSSVLSPPSTGSSGSSGPSGSSSPSGPASLSSPVRPPRPPRILPIPSKITVQVLNSTERTGIAGKATKVLKTDGFVVKKASNDTGGLIPGVGQIRYGPGTLPAATLLSYYFPAATMKLTASTSDIVIVSLGSKYRQPATKVAVRRALGAAHLRLRAVLPPGESPPPAPSPTATPTC